MARSRQRVDVSSTCPPLTFTFVSFGIRFCEKASQRMVEIRTRNFRAQLTAFQSRKDSDAFAPNMPSFSSDGCAYATPRPFHAEEKTVMQNSRCKGTPSPNKQRARL